MPELLKQNFASEIETNGYVVVENVVPPELLARLKNDLINAIEKDAEYHKSKSYTDYAMVLFCPLYGRSFVELIEHEAFMEPVEDVLGKNCILYSYTSTSMPPESGNYSCRIHYDALHTVPDGYINKLQTLLALDDFTLENGATYILPKSHKLPEAPGEEEFYKNAERLTLKAGSVWYAHPRLYHAGARNNTGKWRHAVTTVWCKAYMKQRLDVPRLMANADVDTSNYSERALQKLGYFAQVPASYDEYYCAPEHRKFKQPLE